MKVSKNNFSTFTPDILSRGREYYKSGKVKILSKTKTEVVAEVQGSEVYNVKLKFNEDSVLIDSDCNCPYLRPCKHKAAVLFQLASEDTRAIKQQVAGITQSVFETIKNNITAAYLRRSLDLIRRAKDNLIRYASSLTEEERLSLAAMLVGSMYRSYYYGGSESSIPECFEETVDNLHLSGDELSDFVVRCLKPQDRMNNYYLGEVFSAFFVNQKYSFSAQEGFMKIYQEDKDLARDIISSSSFNIPKKELPIYPPFAVILLKLAPVSANPLFYRKALEAALKVADINSIKAIVKYLNKTHNQKFIPEETYEYLVKRNHEDEAEYLLLDSFFEYDSDFDSYLRLRKYIPIERFKELQPQISAALINKTYLNAVLLRDGSLFPEHSKALSIKKLSCKEIYSCKESIDGANQTTVINLIRKRLTDCKAKGKDSTTDLFYGLLYLDYIHDFYLGAALFEPLILKSSSSSKDLRAIWLGIVSRNNLYSKAGIIPYEVNHVSK